MKGTLSLKTARIISTLFVPPSITILTFAYFAVALETDLYKKLLVIFTSVLFGFVFPILMFFSFRRKGMIIDPDATIKEERILPFTIGILFYIAGQIVLYLSGVNLIIQSFWFCYISNTLIIILITKFWKISVHALGVAGPLAALFYIIGFYAIPYFIILGLVSWSRIKLKVHSLNQVIAGSVLGFSLTYIQIFLIGKLI